ncbi:hypothetical protein, partial [Burkholderia cenocepacia]|uniref:hypothetical protein n=1 Tax=Burkholderia cenocepacia TaxID=95486 RepID=UPI002AB72AC5
MIPAAAAPRPPAAVKPLVIAVAATGADELKAVLTVGVSDAAALTVVAAFAAVDALLPALTICAATR